MKTIWTITMLRNIEIMSLDLSKQNRSVGFYFDKEDAIEAIENNELDINESGYYPYAVLERVRRGCYCDSLEIIWYKWKNGKYVRLDLNPFPMIRNWALG